VVISLKHMYVHVLVVLWMTIVQLHS
jgi:hypothetical protein